MVVVFLSGAKQLIASRIAARQGHFIDAGPLPDVVAEQVVDRLAYFHKDS